MYNMIYSGYGAMGGFDNFTDIAGLGSVFQSYMTGGTKKKDRKKKTGKNKTRKKKTQKRTPMRKPLSSKAKVMSKMRMRNINKLTKKQKKLDKRLKQYKTRENISDSLESSAELNERIKVSSPSMRKFVSKLSTDPSFLSSWPKIDEGYSVENKRKTSTDSFDDARKGLADLLKKKHVYPVKSKSVIKFSDYKSKMKSKEKAVLKAKSKKKGSTR